MSQSIYLYSKVPLHQLEILVDDHKQKFEEFINDSFVDDELSRVENYLDTMAAIFVQPLLAELSFDDFYPDITQIEEQKVFFNQVQSSISLENIPFLESNPFQVSYLIRLLTLFDEVLIDTGGVQQLKFKKTFYNELLNLKNIESLFLKPNIKTEAKVADSLDPIDFLVSDVYKELGRIQSKNVSLSEHLNDLSDKTQKICLIMQNEKLKSQEIFRKTGLHPKDFGDGLERLKFWLRKY